MLDNLETNDMRSVVLLKAIINTATDAIIIIDERGIIQTTNTATTTLLGYSWEEMIDNPVNMLMPAHHAAEHDGYLSRYLETGQAHIIGIGREVHARAKDGKLIPVRLAINEVVVNGQRFFAGFLHDLTSIKAAEARILKLNQELEQKVNDRTEELQDAVNALLDINKRLKKEIRERSRIEEQLLRSQKDLEASLAKEKELSELKSRFVSMASHEFRTPLSTILSSTALISRYTEGDQQKQRDKHIERIKSAVNALNAILNDFLSISKIEEGRIVYNPQTFVPGEICRKAIDEVSGMLKDEQRVELHDSTADLEIVSDRTILKNALFNLLTNAIKYSGEGSMVNVDVEADDDSVHISVRDQGMGIPPEDQKYLFSRFFRASNAANVQGTGLGLNIVLGYLDVLGGDITFESTLGKGSTFKITIPKDNNGQDSSD